MSLLLNIGANANGNLFYDQTFLNGIVQAIELSRSFKINSTRWNTRGCIVDYKVLQYLRIIRINFKRRLVTYNEELIIRLNLIWI